MPDPVVIDFIVKGIPEVGRAIKTVEDTVVRSEQRTTQTSAQQAAVRKREAEREAREKVAIWKKMDAQIKQIQDRAAKDTARNAAKENRDLTREAREKVRIFREAEREVERIGERGRTKARQEAARSQRWLQQQEDKRIAEAERRDRQGVNQQMANRRRFAGAIAGAAVQGVAAGARRVAGVAMQTAGMVTQLGGGFNLSESVGRTSRNEGDLLDLLNSAYNPTSKIKANQQLRKAEDVRPAVQATAARYGLERSTVQEGMRTFTGSTGDFETMLKLMPKLAQLSRATGTDFNKLSEAAGGIGLALDGIEDPAKKAEAIMGVLRTGAGQGKAGAFELKDQATVMPKIVAQASKFEGDVGDNISKLMAIAQATRGGGGAWNAASAATAVTAFAGTFGKNARLNKFKEAGVEVFSDKTQTHMRAPEQIIADAVDKSKGDIPKLTGMFGSVMSLRAINKFSEIYQSGERGEQTDDKGKKLTGREAIMNYMTTMTKGIAMTQGQVDEAADTRMSAADAKMAQVREEFDRAVGEKIIPKLLEMVPALEKLIPQLVDLAAVGVPAFVGLIKSVQEFADAHKGIISEIAQHPIGAIMALEVGRSIGAAGIGEGIRIALMRIIGGASLPVPGGAGGGGAAGAGIGAGPGAAVAAGVVGQALFLKDRYDQLTGGDSEASVLAQIKGGDVEGAQKRVADAKKKAFGTSSAGAYAETLGSASAYVNPLAIVGHYASQAIVKGITGTNSDEQAKERLGAQAIVDSEAIKKAIADAVKQGAAQGAAQAGGAVAPGAPNRSQPIPGRAQ